MDKLKKILRSLRFNKQEWELLGFIVNVAGFFLSLGQMNIPLFVLFGISVVVYTHIILVPEKEKREKQ